jgi:hypothetical protein
MLTPARRDCQSRRRECSISAYEEGVTRSFRDKIDKVCRDAAFSSLFAETLEVIEVVFDVFCGFLVSQ